MSCELEDQVVYITGGAIGIGAFAVKFFLEERVKHVAVSDVNESAGKQLEQELNLIYPGRVSYIKCDVTNEDELFATYEHILREHGHIDLVINNAGLMNDNPKIYKKQIEVNVTALVTSTLKAREIMRKDKSGRGGTIVNISSIAALIQDPFMPIYYSTKSAVLQFSTCIGAPENYENTGVKVLTMCYGATDTSLLSKRKLSSFDDGYDNVVDSIQKKFYVQSVESAAKGLLEACKHGESGSVWLVRNDTPAEDITPAVKKAYGLLSELVFQM